MKESYTQTVQKLLPQSEVFPKHTHELLLQSLKSMTTKQIELLANILKEEQDQLSGL